MRKYCNIFVAITLAGGAVALINSGSLLAGTTTVAEARVQAIGNLGKRIFFDPNLSSPPGQSCASCHDPAAAFTDPLKTVTSQGAVAGRFGNRNTPTVKYTAFVPPFRFDKSLRTYVGGMFLDGRASTLEDQAKQPFLNPLEMNNTNVASLIGLIKSASYAQEFETIFGNGALDDPTTAFGFVAIALATFERTPEVSSFTSKFDAVQAKKESFTPQEQRGFKLFFGRAACSNCHSTFPSGTSKPPLVQTPQVFSNFSYQNDGVPRQLKNPYYFQDKSLNHAKAAFIDQGLGAIVGAAAHNGKFRTPSLRNVDLTAPYMHNGVFVTLEEVVHFYNVRDVDPKIAPPEVKMNISRLGGVGNLRLSTQDEKDLVSFLRTLTDR